MLDRLGTTLRLPGNSPSITDHPQLAVDRDPLPRAEQPPSLINQDSVARLEIKYQSTVL